MLPILDPESFEQLMQRVKEKGHPRALQALIPLNYFLPHLALPKIFDSTHAQRDLRDSGVLVPDVRTYYAKIVEYCLRTNWGRRHIS